MPGPLEGVTRPRSPVRLGDERGEAGVVRLVGPAFGGETRAADTWLEDAWQRVDESAPFVDDVALLFGLLDAVR